MHSSRMHTTRSSSHQRGLPQCMLGYAPLVWAWRHTSSGCGPGDPHPPPWVWAWIPPGQTPKLPSWVWVWIPPWPDSSTCPLRRPGNLQGMLGYHLQCMLGHPPMNRITDTCKKHNLAPTSLRAVVTSRIIISIKSKNRTKKHFCRMRTDCCSVPRGASCSFQGVYITFYLGPCSFQGASLPRGLPPEGCS